MAGRRRRLPTSDAEIHFAIKARQFVARASARFRVEIWSVAGWALEDFRSVILLRIKTFDALRSALLLLLGCGVGMALVGCGLLFG